MLLSHTVPTWSAMEDSGSFTLLGWRSCACRHRLCTAHCAPSTTGTCLLASGALLSLPHFVSLSSACHLRDAGRRCVLACSFSLNICVIRFRTCVFSFLGTAGRFRFHRSHHRLPFSPAVTAAVLFLCFSIVSPACRTAAFLKMVRQIRSAPALEILVYLRFDSLVIHNDSSRFHLHIL